MKDVIENLKGRLAYDGAAVLVSHVLLKTAIETIERYREKDGQRTREHNILVKENREKKEEIERLRGWYDASQDAMGEVLTELRKQTEMLERIRREQVRGE